MGSGRSSARPAATLSLGFLTLGGFVGGVMFWGGFNTALELTNTETFCISCHEMRNNVYEELTPHGPFREPLGGARHLPRLPCAASMDRQDRPQDAGLEGGLGQDLRHRSTRARNSSTIASSWPSMNGRG